MKLNYQFDSRWSKSGGIGRFCDEMMRSESMKSLSFIEGELSEALSIFDPFKLSFSMLAGNYFISPGYNAPILSRNRVIITLHDLMHLNFPEYVSLKNKIYYEVIVKRAIRSSPLVFTVSEFTRSEISKWAGISLDKIAVVPNGVDHTFYNPLVDPIIRCRPYFFYVGNNKPHKNLPALIQAYFHSQLQGKVDLLLSCQPTDELSSLVEKLQLQDDVVFLSGIKEQELPSYYKGALATTIVSLYEGFCLPILESMAVGTPVITSNITAMPEVAGSAAILIDPYSLSMITSALVEVAYNNEIRVNLTRAGIQRAKCYSWDKSRELWDKALMPVLERK